MTDQLWSWLLTAVGWCWYIGLAGQVAWLAYSLITQQWGFLVGVAAYSIVYTRNAVQWTREHRAKEDQ